MAQFQLGVSKNRGTTKSSILIGFSLINHPFWGTPIFGNTQFCRCMYFVGCISAGQGGQTPVCDKPFMDPTYTLYHVGMYWGISYIPFKRAPTAGAPHSKGTTIFPMILCCFARICQRIITKWILNTFSKQLLLFCFFSAPFHTGDGNNSSTS